MEDIWSYLSIMKSIERQLMFKRLFKVAKLSLYCLIQMQEKKGFSSMVQKNKTAFYPSIAMESTLSSILTVKLADVNAVKFRPIKELLKKA